MHFSARFSLSFLKTLKIGKIIQNLRTEFSSFRQHLFSVSFQYYVGIVLRHSYINKNSCIHTSSSPRNKSKRLYLMAAVLSQEDEAKDEVVQSGQRIVVEGWLYKKANLAIQGYKKRWAQINANGEFVYSKNPARLSTHLESIFSYIEEGNSFCLLILFLISSQTRPPVYLRTSSISFNNSEFNTCSPLVGASSAFALLYLLK